tara:strand:+ start:439 stop:702 length:264 start_codon:yes stop_codon:yes gene_type:complete
MKEQDLIDLGFKKSYVIDLYREHEDSGLKPYYYYTYDITNELCLISSDNGEAEKNGWRVEMFDYDNIEFTSKEDIEKLISLIESNKI